MNHSGADEVHYKAATPTNRKKSVDYASPQLRAENCDENIDGKELRADG